MIVLSAGPVAPVRAEIRAEKVRESIARGIRYLKENQSTEGTWTRHPNFAGGVTALCTLALLEAGVPADDPSVQQGLQALRTFHSSPTKRTYTIALMTMVFCRAGNPADLPLIRDNVKWLEKQQIQKGK